MKVKSEEQLRSDLLEFHFLSHWFERQEISRDFTRQLIKSIAEDKKKYFEDRLISRVKRIEQIGVEHVEFGQRQTLFYFKNILNYIQSNNKVDEYLYLHIKTINKIIEQLEKNIKNI